METGEFISEYLIEGGIVLKNRDGGACSLLRGNACSVYADRPFTCRIYPLFRRTRAGMEEFLKPKLLAEGKGIYGHNGTVDQFLRAHDAEVFAAASERYFNLVKQIVETLGATVRSAPELFARVRETMRLHYDLRAEAPVPELIDVDRVVAEYCRAKGSAPPTDVEGSLITHILAIEEKIAVLNAAETVVRSPSVEEPDGLPDTRRHEVLELAAFAGAIGAATSISAHVMTMLAAAVIGGPSKSPGHRSKG